MMRLPLPVILAALEVITLGQAPPQTVPPEPAALTSTRAAFLRQVMLDSQLLTEQYERALAKAETEVSEAGAYEEALAISQRRERLKALYAGTVSSLSTPLTLAQARLTGSAQASGETLSGWRSSGSGAEWLNFRLAPGSYHLEFEVNMSDAPVAGSIYASSKFQPQQTAIFEFNEVTLLGDSSENRRAFEISRSPDETTYATVRVGPLKFSRSPVTLRFQNTTGYPANMIRVRNLRLVPIKEDETAPATASATDATTLLQSATAALGAAMQAARSTATESYLASLSQLAGWKPALKEQVDAEARRIKRLLDQKTGPTGIRSIATAASSLNGFEDLSDARLADGEPAAGDRFTVLHAGTELPIRLLWVKCVPVDETHPAVKYLARHFKIAEEDAVAIGRAAREFTSGYLRDKPLRLLVRPDKDKDGTLPALLFLPDVGLYQNVLAEHGLAAVTAPGRDFKRNATEKAIIDTLVERENAAMKRNPPPGAWALQPDRQNGDSKP